MYLHLRNNFQCSIKSFFDSASRFLVGLSICRICTQQFSGAICGDFVFEFYKNAKIQDTKSADEGADEAEIPTTEGEREQKRGAFIAFPLAC